MAFNSQKDSLTNIATTAPAMSNSAQLMKTPWINAWKDPVAGIKAYSHCVALCDIMGEGEYNLLIADQTQGLKIYQGVNIAWQLPLPETPIAITTFISLPYVPNRRPVTMSSVIRV